MSKRLLLLTIALVLTLLSFSQGQVGSPYSRYGVGDVNANSQARNSAMGGVGYATPYMDDVNYKSPASIGEIDTLTFIFNFGFDAGLRKYSISNPPTSKLKSDAELSQIAVGFACAKWWKMALGITPYSNVGYSIYSADNSFDIDKNYVYAGDGGLNKVFFYNAFNPINDLSLGVGVSYLFGKIYHSNAIMFVDDSTGMYINSFCQKTFKISDVTFDVGLKYNIHIGDDNLRLGAYYAYNRELSAKQSTLVYNTLASAATTVIDTINQVNDVKGKIGLPHTVGFGICYTYKSKLSLAADFTLQNWTGSKFFGECDSLDNSFGIALGGEYTPNKFTPKNLWQSSSYRMGLYFNKSYINMDSGKLSVPDYGITFGVGLKPRHGKTVFNLSFQIGQRGSLKNDLVKENYFTLGVNFSLVDRWFVKSRID
ncbi:MAG: hypothetical protein J6W06_02985 [Bacteroidales bacterium]|nr:hypothetical protein [Bacteroidales bacterium]